MPGLFVVLVPSGRSPVSHGSPPDRRVPVAYGRGSSVVSDGAGFAPRPTSSSTLPDAPSDRRVPGADCGDDGSCCASSWPSSSRDSSGCSESGRRTAESTGNGYDLRVHFASIVRPGLAVPLDIQIQREGGFDGLGDDAVSSSYLSSVDARRSRLSLSRHRPTAMWSTSSSSNHKATPLACLGRPRSILRQHGPKGSDDRSVSDDGNPAVAVSIRTWVLP